MAKKYTHWRFTYMLIIMSRIFRVLALDLNCHCAIQMLKVWKFLLFFFLFLDKNCFSSHFVYMFSYKLFYNSCTLCTSYRQFCKLNADIKTQLYNCECGHNRQQSLHYHKLIIIGFELKYVSDILHFQTFGWEFWGKIFWCWIDGEWVLFSSPLALHTLKCWMHNSLLNVLRAKNYRKKSEKSYLTRLWTSFRYMYILCHHMHTIP